MSHSPAQSVLLLAAALLVWASPDLLGTRRLADAGGGRRRSGRTGDPARAPGRGPGARAAPAQGSDTAGAPGPLRRRLLAAVAGVAAGLLVGGTAGIVAGLAAAVVCERALHRSSDGRRAERAALTRDLPLACELLAICLSAGLPLTGALTAVAGAVPGPVGQELARVSALGRLGADPHRAWADVPAVLRPLAGVVQRAGESGARAVPALSALAADCRSRARAETEAGVRRAGVWVLAPLGLCFLPAFVCLGVAPLVLGIAGEVFG